MRRGAIPIPYIIALIFGIIALAVLGYWLYTQSGKIIGTGGSIECQAKQESYCQQWKILSLFDNSVKPSIGMPGGCPEPSKTMCMKSLNCECKYECDKFTEDDYFVSCENYVHMCCKRT